MYRHLQKGTYTYVTSTFFLLAEKLLRDRERNKDEKGGTSTALTASLESLHDRRKNSGQSDTEEQISGEEDSLAPLDLEMKNSPAVAAATGSQTKKSARTNTMHQVLSSTGLNELDKALPILEEDVTRHSEEGINTFSHYFKLGFLKLGLYKQKICHLFAEDSAGPLPQQVGHVMRRRAHYNHRRVIVPQRSTSCSSSEDEDSEKKKRSLPPHRHKTKSGARCSGDVVESSVVRKSGDSSDDQSGGCTGNPKATGGCSGTSLKTAQSFSREGGDEAEGEDEEDDEDDGGGAQEKVEKDFTDLPIEEPNERSSSPIEVTSPSRDWRICGEDRFGFEEQYLLNGKLSISKSVPGGDENFLGSARSLGNGVPCNLNCVDDYLTENMNRALVTNEDEGFKNGEGDEEDEFKHLSDSPNGLSFAKKGKKLLMNWLFLKKRKRNGSSGNSDRTKCNGTNNGGIPSASGIYKTRSCAELKLRNGVNNLKAIDVNQNM